MNSVQRERQGEDWNWLTLAILVGLIFGLFFWLDKIGMI